jgi:hypothetical protein
MVRCGSGRVQCGVGRGWCGTFRDLDYRLVQGLRSVSHWTVDVGSMLGTDQGGSRPVIGLGRYILVHYAGSVGW